MAVWYQTLIGQHPNYETLAADVATSMISLLKVNAPSVNFQVLDATIITQRKRKFVVLCCFCLPYLSNEESIQLTVDCYRLLQDGRIFYFSFIENDCENRNFKLSVYFHQEDYLQQALKASGFAIVHLLRNEYLKPNSAYNTHLNFIVRK